jgi:hypothetical protein
MRSSIVLLGQFLMSPEGQFLVSLDTTLLLHVSNQDARGSCLSA